MDLLESWTKSLRARGRSQATIDAYLNDSRQLQAWLDERGTTLTAAGRRDVEGFLAELRDRGLAAATIARRYRSLLQLYKWLEEEDELDGDSPMVKMRPPHVPDDAVPIVSDADIAKLLAACQTPRARPGQPKPLRPERATFENKRDLVLLLLLTTTGIRSGELMGLTVADVDLSHDVVVVLGKGSRHRIVALMPETSEAMDKYLRARRKHPQARLAALWLSDKGALTDSGLRQMLDRRAADAGVAHVHPHSFRHTFAHQAKLRGMADGDLMAIAGWRSAQMLHRYGASAAAERGREAHRRFFG